MRPTKAQRLFSHITALDEAKSRQVASVALGIEALELLLVEKGILRDSELMEKLDRLILQKQEEVA
jgi:hypothetical protein